MRPLESIGADDVLTPAEAMRDLERCASTRPRPRSIRTGLPLDRVPLGRGRRRARGPCSTRDGELLAVYEATGTDRIRPAVVVAGG